MTSERKYPDMWVDPEDDPRETDEVLRGEKAVSWPTTWSTTGRRSR